MVSGRWRMIDVDAGAEVGAGAGRQQNKTHANASEELLWQPRRAD